MCVRACARVCVCVWGGGCTPPPTHTQACTYIQAIRSDTDAPGRFISTAVFDLFEPIQMNYELIIIDRYLINLRVNHASLIRGLRHV